MSGLAEQNEESLCKHWPAKVPRWTPCPVARQRDHSVVGSAAAATGCRCRVERGRSPIHRRSTPKCVDVGNLVCKLWVRHPDVGIGASATAAVDGELAALARI